MQINSFIIEMLYAIIGIPLLFLVTLIIWNLKKLEGFIDDYDYRKYSGKK